MCNRGVSLRIGICWISVVFVLAGVPTGARAAAQGEPLAEVDGTAITSEEVDKALGAPLAKLKEQIYLMQRQRVDLLIGERLLAQEARKRGISVQALLDAEVTSRVGLVTEQEIDRVYQSSKGRVKGDEAGVRAQIRGRLQAEKLAARHDAFVRALRAQAKVVVNLKAPPVFRAQVATDGAPFKGPATARVTIVEFDDFHCPFCKRVQPTLAEIASRYPDKVKFVHKDFPIDQLHPASRKGHEAARCAGEQGKFWAYQEAVYRNAPRANPDQLKTYAEDVGLDVGAFEQCLISGTYQAAVQKDIDEGIRAGVTGTPAFFVNGRAISGAQPLERFVQVIEDELAWPTSE